MSHHEDRTPGGPQVGDQALQRARGAAAAAGDAADPDPWAAGALALERAKAAQKARKKDFARQATAMVKEILGDDIELRPGDWYVDEFVGIGNPDSGPGVRRTEAQVTINKVTIVAFAYDLGVPPEGVRTTDYVPLTLELFGSRAQQ